MAFLGLNSAKQLQVLSTDRFTPSLKAWLWFAMTEVWTFIWHEI